MPDSLPLVAIGAGGHAKVVIEAARASGFTVAGALAAPPLPSSVAGAPILGGDERMKDEGFLRDHAFVLGLGDLRGRRRLLAALSARAVRFVTVLHPAATVSPSARLGCGTVVLGGAVVNADCEIGAQVVINTLASVDHDGRIGDGTMISPHAALAGGVACGIDTFIGTGAVLVPGTWIGAGSFVGAGEVVAGRHPDGSRIVSGRACWGEKGGRI